MSFNKSLHLGILKSADRMSAFPSGNSNHKHFLDPDSDPDSDPDFCSDSYLLALHFFGALKAQYMPAQGNALGNGTKMKFIPEGARQDIASASVLSLKY